jgi:hypothetical protein
MVKIFQVPLPDASTVYPCTVADIEEHLVTIPESDLVDLQSISLVPSTRKNCNANGRYFYGMNCRICLYSYPASLSYKLLPHTKRSDVERGWAVELSYGMRVEPQGSRWVCSWNQEDLRRFIVKHVLLHEIGHHVYDQQRRLAGLVHQPRTRESEQFAEAYAFRHAARVGRRT